MRRTRSAPLDWGSEVWRWDVSRYESVPGIVAALNRAGRPSNDDVVLYEATHTLMLDVIEAAGGVESAYERFRRAMADTHATYLEWIKTAPPTADATKTRWALPELEDAWYALEDLLVWVRKLDDRLRRESRWSVDQGLIPALAEGPRRDTVIRAKSRLKTACLDEARHLSNLSLHMHSMEAGSKSVRVVDGRLFLRFPDRVAEAVSHRWQLTFNDGRDAVSVADEIMASVERFMEEMITAFEDNLPERFKTGTA